jgi:hypothetical protein
VENKEIKAGMLPEGWDENLDRLQQKDLDARWTIKNGIGYYGYKNSICIDVDHGFIRRYAVIHCQCSRQSDVSSPAGSRKLK